MSCALKLMMAVALLSSFVQAQSASNNASPSVADAEKFIQQTEQRLSDLSVKQSQAHWVQETYITDDTEAIAATADENSLKTISELAAEAKKYEGLKLPPEQARKLKLLKLSATAPAPSDPKERTELAKLGTWLDGTYGKGKYCPNSGPFAGKCLGQSEMERAMATTKDPAVLLDLWVGWHAIATHVSWNWRIKAHEKWASPIWERCGGRITTCLPTSSEQRLSAYGSRYGRYTFPCMLTCDPSW